MIAVVEAKAAYHHPGDGLQQAKEYAQMLDLKFAYSTNGRGIVEHNLFTGRDTDLEYFPTPDDLWKRLNSRLNITQPESEQRFLTPSLPVPGKPLRYYQEIAINRVIQAIIQGRRRVLLTMATGTGKTDVSFHICWKLWSTRWNKAGEPRRPRILFLSDRSILVDDPKDKQFTPFGDARWKIAGEAVMSREMYFATYQAIAKDERRPGLYHEYKPDFFDLIITEEIGVSPGEGVARVAEGEPEPVKYYVDGGRVGITAHLVYELDADGKKLRVVKYADYAAEKIRSMYTSAADLRSHWGNAEERVAILESLEQRGVTLDQLFENIGQPDADPFDLLCYVAYNAPVRTRRERAERLRKGRTDFWESFKPEARQILVQILEKYIEYGTAQFTIPAILNVPPISKHGNVIEIAEKFGGPEKLRSAVETMQALLYAA